jgi:hypothetical protein
MYKMRDGWTDERMDDFRDEVNRRFDKFEDDVDQRFDAIDKRFDNSTGVLAMLVDVLEAPSIRPGKPAQGSGRFARSALS